MAAGFVLLFVGGGGTNGDARGERIVERLEFHSARFRQSRLVGGADAIRGEADEELLRLTQARFCGAYRLGTRAHALQRVADCADPDPLTEEVPKPMLPVGGRPLLELTIEQLRNAGIRRVNLATHYKGDVISRHFGDGRDFQMDIQYVEEQQPLGTAGALRLLDSSDEPLLVINGDILTRVDFRAMLDYHRENVADMTVAVKEHEARLPYGVVDIKGINIVGISEKPVLHHFINAGIYLLNPQCSHYIPVDQPYDMPDLIGKLIEEGRRVVSFPIHEYWVDIGQAEDYQRAQMDSNDGV